MNLFVIIVSGVLIGVLLYLIINSPGIDDDLDLEKNKHERFFRREINRK